MSLRKKLVRYLGLAFLVALLVGAGFTLHLDQRVRSEFEGRRFALPARIYARPLELHAGLRMAQPDVEDELRQLGYREEAREGAFGWFVRSGDRLEIALRPFVFWDGPQPAKHLSVAFEGGTALIRAINDTDGNGACTSGEPWGEVSAPIADDDTVKVSVQLKAQPCPAE